MLISTRKKHLSASLSLALGVSATALLAGCGGGSDTKTDPSGIDPTQPVSDWQLVWSDEFDGDAIDTSKWNHEVNCDGGGNQEQQCYTDNPENSYIEDGKLNIVALPAEEGADLPFTSARMTTQYKGDFTYGRIEMNAKLPSGQGSWPAFWMMPTDSEYGGWPRSGEIDIVESVNLKAAREDGTAQSQIYGTLHYGKAWPNNAQSGQEYTLGNGVNPADDFHTYAIEWEEGEIRWYIDDYLYATQRRSEIKYNGKGQVKGLNHRGWFTEYYDQNTGEMENHWENAPYDKDFFMILNYAVGGDWPTNVNETHLGDDTGIDAEAFTADNRFEIDYVRVYQCQINPETGKGCGTVRANYDQFASEETPDGALVEGSAPTPPIEGGSGNLPDINVFIDSDTEFAAGFWTPDMSGIEFEDVVRDDEHGTVKQVSFTNDAGGIAYFQSGNDTTDMSDYGNGHLEFDLFVVADNGADDFTIKMDCIFPCTSNLLTIDRPVEGEWKSYKIALADLVNNEGSSLDLGLINTPFAFAPTENQMNGYVVQVDNVRITNPPAALAPFEVFIDQDTAFLPAFWAESGDITFADVDLGDEHGVVKSMTFNTDAGLGYLQAADPVDVSAYTHIEFDLFIENDNGAPDLTFKMDCEHPCSTGEYPIEKPVAGEWKSYSIALADLVAHPGSVLDTSNVNTPIVLFPTWGNQNGFVIYVDNVRYTTPGGAKIPPMDVFTDIDTDFLAGFYAADGTGDITIEDIILADEHATVKQFTFNTDEGLGYFQATEGVDVSEYSTINFDLFVVTDNGAPDLIIKMECGWPCGSKDFAIEKAPVGEWKSYSIPLADLENNVAANGEISTLDLSIVNTPLTISPTWTNQKGFVVQVDNVRFE